MASDSKKRAPKSKTLAPIDVDSRIHEIRGEKVLIDADLAEVYGVTTAVLNQAVKRNESRFPDDFRFRLTRKEFENLISQSVTSSSRHGGRRKLPWRSPSTARSWLRRF